MSIKNRTAKWDTGAIHSTNYGDLVILERFPKNMVKVRFLYTGTEKLADISAIMKGNVKDYNLPFVYGVGWFGQGEYKAKIKGKLTSAYRTWTGILCRCYGDDSLVKFPTYAEVTVDKEWLNYQNFAEWFYKNRPKDYEKVKYQLDKDILSKDHKVYSPSTCCFVTRQVNIEASQSKKYKFVAPDKTIHDIFNLSKFCKEHKLNTGSMCWVHSGKRAYHKGWTKYKGDSDEE